MMDAIQKSLLHEVAELDALPVGAYNIRANGKALPATPPPILILKPSWISPALIFLFTRARKKKACTFPWCSARAA